MPAPSSGPTGDKPLRLDMIDLLLTIASAIALGSAQRSDDGGGDEPRCRPSLT
jgi:hypothetical protein